jgi:RimJ/RimL family protein N-acetyltransferase
MGAVHLEVVSFRRTEPADLDYVLSLETDPDNSPHIIPWTREQHLQALSEDDTLHLQVEALDWGERVGFAILRGIAAEHDSIEFKRIVIGTKGRGFGRATVRLVKHLVFEQLSAHRLWLDVKQCNQRAKALYESEGFVVEGTLRECLKGYEGYDSIVVMSMLASEYARGERKQEVLTGTDKVA